MILAVIIIGIIIFIGGFVIALQLKVTISHRIRMKTYTQCTATVVEKKRKLSNRRRSSVQTVSFQPVFEYFADDKQYRLAGYCSRIEISSSTGVPEIGEKRVLWFNPDDPNEAFVEEPLSSIIFPILIGLFFFGLGMVFLFFLLQAYFRGDNTAAAAIQMYAAWNILY